MNQPFNRKKLRSVRKLAEKKNKGVTDVGQFSNDLKQKLGDDAKISVIYANQYRAKPKEPFALLFYETCLSLLLKKVIGLNEVVLLLYLVKTVDDDNLVLSLTKAKIAKDLGVDRSTVSRAWRKLSDEKIILESEDDHVYINPHLINRSGLAKMRESATYSLASAARGQYLSTNPQKEFGLPEGF